MTLAQKIIEGLQILSKYEDNEIAAEHDTLYAGPLDAESVSEEDKAKLEELGWFIEGDTGSWTRYV